mgnify:CR=1 FL=1
MDKKIERNIIWTLAIILILVGVFGCVAVPTTNLNPKKTTPLDTIILMKDLGTALGCAFVPNDPACQREPLELHTR